MKRLKSLVRPLTQSISSQPVHPAPFLSATQPVVFSHQLIVNQLRQYSGFDKKKSWIEEEKEKKRAAEEFASFKAQYNGKQDKPKTEQGMAKDQLDKEVKAAQEQFYQFLLSHLKHIPKGHRGKLFIFLYIIGNGIGLAGIIGLINWLKNERAEQAAKEISHSESWSKYQYMMQPVEYYLPPSQWEKELDKRLQRLKASAKEGAPLCLAITGLPVSGKSELAQYFAMKYLKKLKTLEGLQKEGLSSMPIVWTLNAESPESLQNSYQNFASICGIATTRGSQEDEKAYQARLRCGVNQVLQTKPGWLLLFDNAASYEVIKAYVPHNGHQQGIVLVTSRDIDFFHDRVRNLDISQGLNPDEAIVLLKQISGINDEEQADKLASAIEYLPHYLAIAAYTIKKHNEDHPQNPWSFENYLQKVLDNRCEKQKVIAKGLPYNKTQHEVIELALENIIDPQAKELFGVCSLLRADNIPSYLLKQYVLQMQPELTEEDAENRLEEIIKSIKKTGLLQYQPQQEGYRINRITQQVIKQKDDFYSLNDAAPRLANSLLALFPESSIYKTENFKRYQVLLTHCDTLISDNYMTQLSPKIATELLSKMGKTYIFLREEKKAQQTLLQALPQIESIYGKEHLEVAKLLNNLAITEAALGNYSSAKARLERALKIKMNHYHDENIEVMRIRVNLAKVLANLNDKNKAKDILEAVLPVMKTKYSKNHLEIAITSNILGTIYRKLGDYSDAKHESEYALNLMETHFEANHPDTLKILNSLIAIYNDLEDTPSALKASQRALSLTESLYGTNHPATALVLANMANTYSDLKDYDTASNMLERVRVIFEENYEQTDLRVVKLWNNIANNCIALGDHKRAATLLNRSLPAIELHYGKDSIEAAIVLVNIAEVNFVLKDIKRAIESIKRAKAVFEDKYGSGNHHTKHAQEQLQRYEAMDTALNTGNARFFSRICSYLSSSSKSEPESESKTPKSSR